MLTGNIIFNGNAENALLLEYEINQEELFQKGCLIYSEQLTNEVALLAIKVHAVGLLTCNSSFATHGANILRSYFNRNYCQFLWITNIKRTELEGYIGKRISIINGKLSFPMNERNDSFVRDIVLNPIKNRTKIKYYISKGKMDVCYWPHRKYDIFTFSIMKKGLKKNYEWLFAKKTDVILDGEGRIWFSDGIPLRSIIDLARNYETSELYLEKQVEVYHKIILNISSQMIFSKCVELLIEYFTVFILYHNTYEYVLLDIYYCAESAYGAEFANECINVFLFCCIDEWMLMHSLTLEKHKSLYASEPLTPVPNFSIYDDIKKKEKDIYNYFEKSGKLVFYEQNRKKIQYWIKVFVVKEWKFVINKILFTRCGKKIREFCANQKLSLIQIQKMMIDRVLKIMGDLNEYI
ncbi:hypothetical protein D3Z62_09120 [Lachnospiraceae bacterium]|nr:hypothetical protein [Lachnospiraceae bacterium]